MTTAPEAPPRRVHITVPLAVDVSQPPWSSPFPLAWAVEGKWATEAEAPEFVARCFESWLTEGVESGWWFGAVAEKHEFMVAHLRDLRGRDLACTCPLDQPCHADVLLRLANPGWLPA